MAYGQHFPRQVPRKSLDRYKFKTKESDFNRVLSNWGLFTATLVLRNLMLKVKYYTWVR